ncbi:ABC transporter permease [Amycolatopsis sp. NPDC021455]|uniref:ABC transporter permease n=1 Tax=Amycolatopsis sp. NPDC021455 TaxID=3154901 RepID=UPI0033E55051
MRVLREITWIELKLFAREPITVVFVLVLPLIVLYVLNGVFGNQPAPSVYEGVGAVDFYTPAYVALVVATVGVLSVPVHLAGYREHGVLRRFRASALSPVALLGAHMIIATVTGTVGAVLLTTLSTVGYHGVLPHDWAGVAAGFLLITAAFAALGAFLGVTLPTARAAQGLGVLLFFVFLMLGGAGPPREVLPGAMSTLADAVPLTYASAVLRDPWLGRGWDGGAVAVMSSVLLVSLALTWWRLRRVER